MFDTRDVRRINFAFQRSESDGSPNERVSAMDMTGEYRIEAPRDKVWEALNDPEILKQAIPGCQEIEKQSDTEMAAKVTAKVGPVKASFSGQVTLSDLDPPNSYRISGEGKGGAAGFAKGGANVTLEPDGDATILKYEVNATVGGKLAQLGARLIDGTAKKMANEFFAEFAKVVEAGQPAAAVEGTAAQPTAEPGAAPAPAGEKPGGVKTWVWVAGVVIAVLVVLAILS